MTCIVTTSWDDGHPLDFRLAELLKKYDVPGTFYVPLENPERPVMTRSQIRELAQAGFEVGGHTLKHVRLTSISPIQAEQEIVCCKDILEDYVGGAIRVFCYPGGRYNRMLLQKVQQAGYIGARAAERFHIQFPTDLYQVMTTQQVMHFSLAKNLKHLLGRWNMQGFGWYVASAQLTCDWSQLAMGLFETALRTDGVWHLWGHSWEIDSIGAWGALETVLRAIAGRGDVNYLNNGQLAEYVRASRKPTNHIGSQKTK